MDGSLAIPVAEPATKWRTALAVGLAFLAYNMAIGMGFGAYGTLVETIQTKFDTSRALASSGISVLALILGVFAPMVATITKRIGLRATMMTGAALCALGYLAITYAGNIYVLLGIFALLIGPGACLLGPIPAAMLASSWAAPARRGQALGIANMPLFVCLFPLITSYVLRHGGFNDVFFLLAGLMVAFVPVLLLVRENHAVDLVTHGEPTVTAPAAGIFRRPAFIVAAAGSSLITATGMIMVSHLVSIGADRGLTLPLASALLSVFGIAGAGGTILFGILADRTSVRAAFATVALVAILPLFVIGTSHAFLPLLLAAGVMGLCTSAVTGLQSAAIATWLGQANFARAMGLLYVCQVPFLFGAAPLAGFMVDKTGSYTAVLLAVGIALAATFIMFLFFRPRAAA
jgi:MFS family permease